MSHQEPPVAHRDPPPARARLWAAAAGGTMTGLGSGLLVGLLMAYQGMAAAQPIGPVPGWVSFGAYGALGGAVLGPLLGRRPFGLAVAVSGGVMVGLLGWPLWFLTLEPVLRGGTPSWSAAAAAAGYRQLVGSLLSGGLTAALLHGALLWTSSLRAGGARGAHGSRGGDGGNGARTDARPADVPRVVIVGGGFAGVSAAQRFERLSLRGHPCDVTLVSESNYLLFTPMLAEVASGALEPQHISAPVRAAAAHTRFVHGRAERIDVAARRVHLARGSAGTTTLPYDHLVLAVGSVPHVPGLPGVAEHALTLKNLGDATRLRDHVLGLLERADREPDPAERRRQLTFVVAGGGFAGTETVAELFDLVHGVLHYYPGVDPREPRFVLVHAGPAILPELSPRLGAYALERLRARGIEFRLGVRAAAATGAEVHLADGTAIPCRTFVWTAGGRPGPLADTLPAARARGGGLIVDPAFRVRGADGLWAIGDCADIPDVHHDGASYPPTAQHAQREGRQVADNIVAVLEGKAPRMFRFRTLGVFVALGHRTAAGEIRGRRFSGLAAWLMWRGIYLAKLPGLEKRARVLFDWVLDLVFPRDIAVLTRSQAPPAAPMPPGARPGAPVTEAGPR